MKSAPEILCFASGGVDIGYGHLYRLTNLITSLKLESKAVFIATNKIEREFLKNAKLLTQTAQSAEMQEYKHVIIDSKYDCMNIINKYIDHQVNIIIVDNIDGWTKKSALIVIPSFFLNRDQVKSSNLYNSEKLLWGKNYTSLKEPKVVKKNTF